MPAGLNELLHRPNILILVSIAVATLVAAAIAIFRQRTSPDEAERERRETVHRIGRLLDATVTDIQDSTIFFTYSVGGIEYQATQHVSSLADRMPDDAHHLLGPATIKYVPSNPANSIVICEKWCGLRVNRSHSSSRHARATQAVENGSPFG